MYAQQDNKPYMSQDDALLEDFKKLLIQTSNDLLNLDVFDKIEKIHRDMEASARDIVASSSGIKEFYEQLKTSTLALPEKFIETDEKLKRLNEVMASHFRTIERLYDQHNSSLSDDIKESFSKAQKYYQDILFAMDNISNAVKSVNSDIGDAIYAVNELKSDLDKKLTEIEEQQGKRFAFVIVCLFIIILLIFAIR